jgi:predicted AlkP superfamily pyrophosphatase or phosphodiesterase
VRLLSTGIGFGLSLALALTLGAAAVRARVVPVVLLSIDGLGSDYLRRADARGLRIPELRRLSAEGVRAERMISVTPALTYPAHTTLVTGVSPARHGIVGNRPFDPMGRNGDGWYWYSEDIRTATLWDAAQAAHLTTASVDWPVTVGAGIQYNVAQYWRAPDGPDDAKLLRALSTRGLLAEAERQIGPPAPVGSIEEDERRGELCAFLLRTRRPALQLCYLSALDEAQHRTEPGSPAALAALERLDAVVGRVRSAAEEAGGGRAVLAVVSDHGFVRTERELDLNEALRRAGLLQLDGEGRVRGWRAFAWGQGGSASLVLRDRGDREGRQRLRALLGELSGRPGAPVARVEELSSGNRGSGSPAAAFTVFLAPDARLVDARAGFVTRTASVAGDHGHDPALPEMSATLLLAGRGVPRGLALDRVELTDVAPTLAALMGLSLPGTEGRDLLARSAPEAARSAGHRGPERLAFR